MVHSYVKKLIHPSIHQEWQFSHFYAHNYRGLNLVEIRFCLNPFLPGSSHLHCPLMCRYGTVLVCGTSIYRPVVKQKRNWFYTILITSWPYEKSIIWKGLIIMLNWLSGHDVFRILSVISIHDWHLSKHNKCEPFLSTTGWTMAVWRW